MMLFNHANCIVSTGFRSPFGSKIFLSFDAFYNCTSEAMVIDSDKTEALGSKRSYLSGNSILLEKKISCGLRRLSIGKEISYITQFEFPGNDELLDDCKNTKTSCEVRTVRTKDGDNINGNNSKKNGDITRDLLLPNASNSISENDGSSHSEELLLLDDLRRIDLKKNQKNSCDWKTGSTTDAILYMEQTAEFPSNDDFISILLKCKKEKDLLGLNRMFSLISDAVESNRNRSLGNYFVPAFVDCGSMACAVHVFEKLQYRNEYSWTSLIQGYIDQGETQHAFDLYDRMKQEFVYPNSFTFVALLTACVRSNMINEGRDIHCEIAMEGYETDRFIGSILVDLYAKCGFLEEAQDVFDTLLARDVVLWTALIAGYVEHFLPEKALPCFERMRTDGIAPDAGTYVCILKACTSLGALIDGQRIHSEVIKKGYEANAFVGNTLVDLYAKFGKVAEAESSFDRLAFRDIISWNALIAGYSDCGHGKEVLRCLESMRGEISPNAVTLSCSLKACGSLQCINTTRDIHCELVKKGFENEGIVGNTLIDTYVKCNSLTEAHQSFDKLESRDIVAWNTIFTAYGELALGEDAFNCFEEMKSAGLAPNYITFVCTLKALGSEGVAKGGQALHIEIMKQGLETNTVVGNTLVDMYAKCGLLSESWKTFMGLSMHDVVTWNVVIAGYAERKLNEEVENCFKSMQLEGIFPDGLTYIFVLKSCYEPGALGRGQKYHAEVVKDGFESNFHVTSCLVVLYSRCGQMAEAQEVFDTMDTRDVVTWTALIGGYAEYGSSKEALNCFQRMCIDGVSPNAFTYVSGLRACSKLSLIHKGQIFHSEIAKKGYERDAYICSALVDAYCKCGFLEEAHGLVDRLPSQDIISWTALISGYADLGRCEEARICFEEMQQEGIYPDVVVWNSMILSYAEIDCEKALKLYGQLQEQGVLPDSRIFVGVLKACGEAVALETGKKFHSMINRLASETSEVVLTNAIVDMYGRCGSMTDARKALDTLPEWELASWNTLSTGYARQGDSDRVFELVRRMRTENIEPDGVSFLNVLTACNHAGLVDTGMDLFLAMIRAYRINPTLKHQNCMVDLLGRAGRLDEAVLIAETMPLEPDFVIWSTMLSACRKWGDVELGKRSFDSALNSDDSIVGAYILMVNIYSDARMWTDAMKIEALRLNKRWMDANVEDET